MGHYGEQHLCFQQIIVLCRWELCVCVLKLCKHFALKRIVKTKWRQKRIKYNSNAKWIPTGINVNVYYFSYSIESYSKYACSASKIDLTIDFQIIEVDITKTTILIYYNQELFVVMVCPFVRLYICARTFYWIWKFL